MTAEGAPNAAGRPLPRNALIALAAWVVAGIVYVVARGRDSEFAMFWAFGLAFGFVLQRARFCFASAFRDIFLLGHARNMKGVLLGLAVGALGFGLLMSQQIPNTSLSIYPSTATFSPWASIPLWVGCSSAWAWSWPVAACRGASTAWARVTSRPGSRS